MKNKSHGKSLEPHFEIFSKYVTNQDMPRTFPIFSLHHRTIVRHKFLLSAPISTNHIITLQIRLIFCEKKVGIST